MSPAPRRALFLAAVLLLQAGRAGALGPSNLDLVSRAAARAVQEAVAGLDTAGHGEGFATVSLPPPRTTPTGSSSTCSSRSCSPGAWR